MTGLVCVESRDTSSAYVMVWTFGGGSGRSAMYMLNRVGDSPPPCRTPVLMLFAFDLVLL